MLNFRKILCPVDFDRNSAAALRFAAELAEPESVLYLLHTVPVERPEFELTATGRAEDSLENFAREHVADKIERELLVRTGDPAVIIVRAAEEIGADLIVMATHGYKGLVRTVLGSVTERVLREAKCPVISLRPAAPVQPASA
jgi:universal stress protein A